MNWFKKTWGKITNFFRNVVNKMRRKKPVEEPVVKEKKAPAKKTTSNNVNVKKSGQPARAPRSVAGGKKEMEEKTKTTKKAEPVETTKTVPADEQRAVRSKDACRTCAYNDDREVEMSVTYSAPCAIGDYVYRTTVDTDDSGNVSWKVQKGRVIAITIDEQSQVWLRVDMGVNIPTLNLRYQEFDYTTAEVGARIESLQ